VCREAFQARARRDYPLLKDDYEPIALASVRLAPGFASRVPAPVGPAPLYLRLDVRAAGNSFLFPRNQPVKGKNKL